MRRSGVPTLSIVASTASSVAHSPPRGALCAAAAEAKVFPSQPVSPVAVAAGILWGLWPWTGRGVLVGLLASAGLYCPGKGEGPVCVKLPGVPGSVLLLHIHQ